MQERTRSSSARYRLRGSCRAVNMLGSHCLPTWPWLTQRASDPLAMLGSCTDCVLVVFCIARRKRVGYESGTLFATSSPPQPTCLAAALDRSFSLRTHADAAGHSPSFAGVRGRYPTPSLSGSIRASTSACSAGSPPPSLLLSSAFPGQHRPRYRCDRQNSSVRAVTV